MTNKTAFITRCWKKPPEFWRACLAQTLMAVLVWGSAPAEVRAETVIIKSAKLDATEEGYQLDADFEFQLNAAMQEAVRKGVPLYFVVEFELTRGRWYWLDQKVAQEARDRRLSYAPLTEQYRISVSGVSQNVSTFEEVRRILSRVRSWTVVDKGKLKPGERYEAALRFRLDNAQLPKPFQLSVMTSKEWSLTSDWYRWSFVAGAEK